jgi:hypothetical protein
VISFFRALGSLAVGSSFPALAGNDFTASCLFSTPSEFSCVGFPDAAGARGLGSEEEGTAGSKFATSMTGRFGF